MNEDELKASVGFRDSLMWCRVCKHFEEQLQIQQINERGLPYYIGSGHKCAKHGFEVFKTSSCNQWEPGPNARPRRRY